MKNTGSVIAAIAALCVLLGLISGAVRAQQPITIFHFDDSSCGAWASVANDRVNRQTYLFWMRGYISGYNFSNPGNQVRELPTNDTLSLYVDKYCRDNPLYLFTLAAQQLIVDLTKPSVGKPKKAP